MLLYLLRHAEAEVFTGSDRDRRLTEKGRDQAVRAGEFCRKRGIVPGVILTSPVRRALETAKLVAQCLPAAELIEVPWATCGMDAATAIAELGAFAKFPSVMLVGHQPDLGKLAAGLLGLPHPQGLRVRKCLLAGIDAGDDIVAGRGSLQFFMPVKLMD